MTISEIKKFIDEHKMDEDEFKLDIKEPYVAMIFPDINSAIKVADVCESLYDSYQLAQHESGNYVLILSDFQPEHLN